MSLDLCSVNMPNGGAPDCDKTRGIPRYLIIGSYEFTAADLASTTVFKARLKTQTLLATGAAGKLIVFPIIQNVEKKTADHQTGTLNQGFSEVLREGFPAWDYGVRISNYHSQLLRQINNQSLKIFTVDHNLNVWGTWTSNSTFRGESAQLFIGGDDFSDGQNSKFILVSTSYLDVEEFKQSSKYYPIDFSVSDYGKLKNVILTLVTSATNVHNITGKLNTGRANYQLDVYLDYATPMANAARWTATNVQTGVAITITTVATNAAGYWVVTLDSTMWTALSSGDKVIINWAPPTTIDAVAVTGVEGFPLTVTKP